MAAREETAEVSPATASTEQDAVARERAVHLWRAIDACRPQLPVALGECRQHFLAAVGVANHVPGTNGGGTLIWYSLAISSTSGKFTAAAPTFTRTCPCATGSDGRSSMRTTSDGP